MADSEGLRRGRDPEPGGSRLRMVAWRATIVTLSISFIALVAAILLRPSPVPRPSRTTVRLEPLSQDEWERVRGRGQRVGPTDARLELIVFNDYECPFCRRTDKVVTAVRDVFADRLAVIYRHYPLRNHQPDAYEKARLAECAARAGRFSELQSFLYPLDVNDPGAVSSMAREADIDAPEFLSCAADTARVPEIEEDLALIREIGTRRTPSVFLQGHLLTRTPDSTQLHDIVEGLLEGR